MAICRNCGAQVEDGKAFCPACGQAIEQPQEQQYAQPQAPQYQQPQEQQYAQPQAPQYQQPQEQQYAQPQAPQYQQPQEQQYAQPQYQQPQEQQYAQPQYQQPQEQQYAQPQYQQQQQYQQPQQGYPQQGYQQPGQPQMGVTLPGADYPRHKSSLGLEANIAILIIYGAMVLLSWIPYGSWLAWAGPLVFLFLEKQSVFVKFHAAQALCIGVARAVPAIIIQIIIIIIRPKVVYSGGLFGLPTVTGSATGVTILSIVTYLIAAGATALAVIVALKAYGYKHTELPVLGPFAKKISKT